MKVLVTGATGFVGRWLVRRLLDLGHEVRILARESRVDSEFLEQKLDISPGDVTKIQSVLSATEGRIDTVFHLAGVVGYSRAMRNEMTAVNVNGTANVVEACIQNGVRRLVHMSSVVAVGAAFDEAHILNEESRYNLSHLDLGYFETKRKAEELVLASAKAGKLDAVCVNPSTIYGPGDATKGSRRIQMKVAQGNFPFYTNGGVNVVHIEDVIVGVVAAWQKGKSGERYILAGENIKIRELFEIIASAAGVKAPWIYLPNQVVLAVGKYGDFMERRGRKGPINTENAWASILYHWFDSSKAQSELGFFFRPAHAAIEESVLWMKQNKYL